MVTSQVKPVEFGSREAAHDIYLFCKGQTELLEEAYQRVLLEKGARWLVVKSLLWCAVDTMDSLLPLAQRGKLRDCYVLARTAFETILNTCFVCAKGEEVAQRALRHARQKAYRDLRQELRIGRTQLEFKWTGEVNLDSHAGLRSAVNEFTSGSGREIAQWTPESVVDKIEAVDARYGRQVSTDLQFADLVIYRHASEIAHGSFFGVLFSFGAAEPGGPPTNEQAWQSDQRKRMSLLLMMLGGAASALIAVVAQELPGTEKLLSESERMVHELTTRPWVKSFVKTDA